MTQNTDWNQDFNPNVQRIDGLGDFMKSVLENVAGVFNQAGVYLPDRQYIAFGETAHDCEQLTVSFEQMYIGAPGDQAQFPNKCQAGTPRSAVLVVQLVRKIPAFAVTGGGRGGSSYEPPSPEQITEVAYLQARDATLLLETGVTVADAWGPGIIADVGISPASGEYQAVVLNLIAAVP